MLFLKSGTPELVRNHDIQAAAGSAWPRKSISPGLRPQSQRLGEVESGMRRNLLRSLSLDTFATSLER